MVPAGTVPQLVVGPTENMRLALQLPRCPIYWPVLSLPANSLSTHPPGGTTKAVTTAIGIKL